MKIWHQSFTVLDDVPHYRDALERHLRKVAAPDTDVHLRGMKPGPTPATTRAPTSGTPICPGCTRSSSSTPPCAPEDEGYDAFLIATIPDTAYEECRSVVDIPVLAYGHTSVLMAATWALRSASSASSAPSRPQLRPQPAHLRPRPAGRADPAGGSPSSPTSCAPTPPPRDCSGVPRRRPRGHRCGRHGHRPRRGPLNVFLADHGVSRVDDVLVVDSLGTLLQGRRAARPPVPLVRPDPVPAAASTTSSPRASCSTRPTRASTASQPRSTTETRTQTEEPERARGHRGRRRRRRSRRLRRHDRIARLGEPRRRRRGPREEHDRGVQRRRVQRQPRCGRDSLPNRSGHRGLSPAAYGRHPRQLRGRAAPGPRHGALRGRPRLRALDRRRPRLPHGRRHRHGHARACRYRACTRTPLAPEAARSSPTCARCSPTDPTSPCSTRPPSPACASRTALSWVSPPHRATTTSSSRAASRFGHRTGSPATAPSCRSTAPSSAPFHGGVSTATGDSIGWLRPLGAEFRNMSACLRHGQVTLRGTRG